MALINPDLNLPQGMAPEQQRALKKAWREAIDQLNNFSTVYHQSTRPVIPDGTSSPWHDTSADKYYWVTNFGQGVIKTVEMT